MTATAISKEDFALVEGPEESEPISKREGVEEESAPEEGVMETNVMLEQTLHPTGLEEGIPPTTKRTKSIPSVSK